MHWVKNYHPKSKKDGKAMWTTISLFDVNSWYNDGSGRPPSVGTEENVGQVLEDILSQELKRIWKSKMETTKLSENDCQEITSNLEVGLAK